LALGGRFCPLAMYSDRGLGQGPEVTISVL